MRTEPHHWHWIGQAGRRQPSLLGNYPVPALHLVGAPVPRTRQSPLLWSPGPPPPQYGIDYTFAHRIHGEAARWQAGRDITVRIAGEGSDARRGAVATVVAELRALTGLRLADGAPGPAVFDPSAVPEGEIHVGYLTAPQLAALPGRCADRVGLGGAETTPGGGYFKGFAIVNADLAEPDEAASMRGLAILRHELAHALGLGHAGRPSLLMHYRLTGSTTHYGRGDRHGLAQLGPAAAGDTTRRPSRTPVRTPPCAI